MKTNISTSVPGHMHEIRIFDTVNTMVSTVQDHAYAEVDLWKSEAK